MIDLSFLDVLSVTLSNAFLLIVVTRHMCWLLCSLIKRLETARAIRAAIYPGAKPVVRPKLIVCGPHGVGKTTLVASLQQGLVGRLLSGLLPGPKPASPVHITHSALAGGGEFSFWDLTGLTPHDD